MATPADPPHGIWTDLHWRAAASPARLQLLTAIEGLGSLTVLALAEATGRSAPSLYPHLEQLEHAGFVVSSEETVDGRKQRVYAPGPSMKLSPVDPRGAHGIARLARASKLLMDDASRRFSRWAATAEGQPIGSGYESRVHAVSHTTWLDDAQRAELNTLVEQMTKLLARARVERRGSLHTVVLAHFPDPRGELTDAPAPADPVQA
jgi:DNA-binding transcriptional ArsR family regulator